MATEDDGADDPFPHVTSTDDDGDGDKAVIAPSLYTLPLAARESTDVTSPGTRTERLAW